MLRRSTSRAKSKLRPGYDAEFADAGFADPYDDIQEEDRPRRRGLKLKLRTRMPGSLAARIVTGAALLFIAGVGITLLMLTRTFLLHDERFIIQSPSLIEIQGNRHLTRGQLLDIFGEDLQRNIFRVSLIDRQTQLEQLSWVQHATLMRLLPNRIRVSILERTPVAFVRQGTHIGLVDANGVFLEMTRPGTMHSDPHYSFPVVTGLSATDPASTRAARMKIFLRFIADLDSSGEKVSEILSEVDLSNPEDIKAMIPANSSELLVHFGDDHFLERYRRFQRHLPEWHAQYPNLRSVDMRYEREVVLDMADSTPATGNTAAVASKAADSAPAVTAATPSKPKAVTPHVSAHPRAKAPAKTITKARTRPVAHAIPHKSSAHGTKPRQKHYAVPPSRPASKPLATVAPAPVKVAAPQAGKKAEPSVSAAARSSFTGKPPAGKPLLPIDSSHPSQVTSR